MRALAGLVADLDEARGTNEKVAVLAAHLREREPQDAAWIAWFLLGNRPKRTISTTALRRLVAESTGLPDWLVATCHDTVGDFAETAALLVPDPDTVEPPSIGAFVREVLTPLSLADEAQARTIVRAQWDRLDASQRFVMHKLLGGAFRLGVSKGLAIRALATIAETDVPTMTHRVAGRPDPTAAWWRAILSGEGLDDARTRPFPFFLASPLDREATTLDEMRLDRMQLGDPRLGDVSEWIVESKWDGVRGQLIRRGDVVALWSRGEERLDAGFPEVVGAARTLGHDVVLDGELVAMRGTEILGFDGVQARIGRKRVERGLFDEEHVTFLAFDLLEYDGVDRRESTLAERRALLESLLADRAADAIRPAPLIDAGDWNAVAAARDRARDDRTEGVMLKRRSSPYRTGRVRGDWWKWKIDPLVIDAVLVAGQPGRGRRAGLLTDYTFALRADDTLVTVTRAYSGLTDAEFRRVDRHLRATTLERHGPVRVVEPELVFEIGFEGVQRSTRHKSGYALRFPRMLRWRTDKTVADADTITTLEAMLPAD